jgi:hypothetical protein
MINYKFETACASIGGFLTFLFAKVPSGIGEDEHRFKVGLISSVIYGLVGWILKQVLDFYKPQILNLIRKIKIFKK